MHMQDNKETQFTKFIIDRRNVQVQNLQKQTLTETVSVDQVSPSNI